MTTHTTNHPSLTTGLIAANVTLTIIACFTIAYLLWVNVNGLAKLDARIPAPSAAAVELENAALRAELTRVKARLEELQGTNARLELRATEAERALVRARSM